MKPFLSTAIAAWALVLGSASGQESEPRFEFGAMADCQYTDHADAGQRLYRRSVGKLRDAVAYFEWREQIEDGSDVARSVKVSDTSAFWEKPDRNRYPNTRRGQGLRKQPLVPRA